MHARAHAALKLPTDISLLETVSKALVTAVLWIFFASAASITTDNTPVR